MVKTMKRKGLSKSRYTAGLQCHKLLWYKAHEPDKVPPPGPHDLFIMEQGTAAGELATERYEGGVTIPAFPIGDSLEQTEKALADGAKYIFEAALNYQEIHVKVDILVNHGNKQVDLIEVKSSTKVKPEHMDDMAIQRYVLEKNGFTVKGTYLMHLNPKYIHPEGDLFTISDETAGVDKIMELVPENLKEIREMLKVKQPPTVDIGPHCDKPYECAMKYMCWEHIPEISIFNIPRFGKKWDFYEQGIIKIEDLPSDIKGSPTQKPFLDSYRSGKPIIDKLGIDGMMDKLEEPLYFMDFETYQLAVPLYDGTRPWQQLPVQWSVHILENGELTHHEFIHDTDDDPREAFTKSLLDIIGDKGSVIVYHATFERGRLRDMAEQLPHHKARLENVISRLWDQLDIFKKFYCDAKFKGSNGLKKTLPVLVPELSYGDLEVQDGTAAMVGYANMVKMEDEEEKEKLKQALLDYCELDTLAMVEMHRVLEVLK